LECERGRTVLSDIQPEYSSLVLYSGGNPAATIIHRIVNKDATKTPGVHVNTLGTFEARARTLKTKIEGVAACLELSHLNKVLALLS
jgi:hypothetical protein